MTQICGVVPLIYGMLLHTGVFAKGHSPAPSPAQFPKHTLDVAEKCLGLLNHVALVDLHMLQVLLLSFSVFRTPLRISTFSAFHFGLRRDTS